MPVKDVNVQISNSNFSSISDENGNFRIDYISGEFDIVFTKANHVTVEKKLNIIERKQYPMGKVLMIRTPISEGIFFKDKYDFIEIPKSSFSYKEKKTSTFFGIVTDREYFIPDSSFTRIEINDEEVEFFDTSRMNCTLLKVGNNNIVSNLIWGALGQNVKCEIITDEETEIIENIYSRKFTPSLNQRYVFVWYQDDGYRQYIEDIGFAFELVKKE